MGLTKIFFDDNLIPNKEVVMRKFVIAMTVTMLLIVPLIAQTAVAEECAISLRVNSKLIDICGKKFSMDVAPINESESVYLPLRYLSEWLAYDVSWIESERAVMLRNDQTSIKLWIGKTDLVVDGQTTQLTVPPIISRDRTLVSSNGLQQMMGNTIEVDGRNITITVDKDELCYLWHDFELPNDSNPDEMIKLSDYMNDPDVKAIVLEVYFTRCKPSYEQLERFGELYRRYEDDGLVIIGINTDGPGLEEERKALNEELGLDFLIALDEEYSQRENLYDPQNPPNFFLLTPGEHCITWIQENPTEDDYEKLEQMVKDMCGVTD